MKAIISIDGNDYLLKSDKSATTVMKALDGAVRVLAVHEPLDYGRHKRPGEILLYDRDPLSASLRMMPEKTKVRVYERFPEEPLGLPEHGQMLLLPEHGTRQD